MSYLPSSPLRFSKSEKIIGHLFTMLCQRMRKTLSLLVISLSVIEPLRFCVDGALVLRQSSLFLFELPHCLVREITYQICSWEFPHNYLKNTGGNQGFYASYFKVQCRYLSCGQEMTISDFFCDIHKSRKKSLYLRR